MPASTGFSWKEWLPIIIGGAKAAGDIVGGVKQAGATNRAIDLNAQATKDALATMAGFFALEYGNKAPYRAAGGIALPELLKMSGLGGAKLPGTPDTGAPISPSLASIFRGANIPVPQFGGAPGAGGGGSLAAALGEQPQFGDIATKGIQSRGSRVLGGALGGLGIGAAGKGLAGALLSGAKSAALGPAMIAGGPAIGAIKGLFDNNNPDKNFASTGINRVSDWTWNTLMPAVKSGQISPQDAEAAFNDVWGKWEGSMASTPGFNKDVAARSVSSQRQYFQPFFSEINRLKQGTSPAPAGGY